MSDPSELLVPDRMLHGPGVIGVPCGEQGRWSEFTRCLSVLEKPKGSGLAFLSGTYIQASRNLLVEQTLDSHALWLLMIDDDHTFDRRLLINLLDRHVPVVGALSLPRKPPYYVCAFERTDSVTGDSLGLRLHDLKFEMQEVAAVGTGAMLIRRDVLEAIDPPWFEVGYDERGVNVSEDVVFCEKARAAGFKVWLDATQQLGHLTGVAIKLVPAGIEIELAPEERIVIPLEQIEEVLPDAAHVG